MEFGPGEGLRRGARNHLHARLIVLRQRGQVPGANERAERVLLRALVDSVFPRIVLRIPRNSLRTIDTYFTAHRNPVDQQSVVR